jgi:hypothetical protein
MSTASGRYGASSPVRHVVSHRLQSADSCRSRDQDEVRPSDINQFSAGGGPRSKVQRAVAPVGSEKDPA